jgi:hypothetical protein
MSTLVHTPSGAAAAHDVRRPVLRLLERPARPPAADASASPAHESVGGWLVRQVERYWAWGEQHAAHHRLGSWLRH